MTAVDGGRPPFTANERLDRPGYKAITMDLKARAAYIDPVTTGHDQLAAHILGREVQRWHASVLLRGEDQRLPLDLPAEPHDVRHPLPAKGRLKWNVNALKQVVADLKRQAVAGNISFQKRVRLTVRRKRP